MILPDQKVGHALDDLSIKLLLADKGALLLLLPCVVLILLNHKMHPSIPLLEYNIIPAGKILILLPQPILIIIPLHSHPILPALPH